MNPLVNTWFVSVEEDGDALRIRQRGLPWGLLPLVTVGAAVLGLGFRVDHPLGMLPPLAFFAMPFAIARWVLDRERRRFGDCVERVVTVAKRASSSGYRDGSLAASVVVDGRGYEAAQVRGGGVEQAAVGRGRHGKEIAVGTEQQWKPRLDVVRACRIAKLADERRDHRRVIDQGWTNGYMSRVQARSPVWPR